MAAVIDELRRRVSGRSALLTDLQKLYEDNWPPADSEELILFGEESVHGTASQTVGISNKTSCRSMSEVQDSEKKHLTLSS